MKKLTVTEARSRFGQVIDYASTDLVMLTRRRKESVALMPAEEARVCILSAYATGVLTRAVTMSRLGYTWYGQLADAMTVADLRIHLPDAVVQQMGQSLDAVFGQRGKRVKRGKRSA